MSIRPTMLRNVTLRVFTFVCVSAQQYLVCAADIAKPELATPGYVVHVKPGNVVGNAEHYDIIEVINKKTNQSWHLDLSELGQSPRSFYRGCWSSDGRFFAFSTTSVHSVWHTNTYIFGVRNKQYFEIDRYIGPVIDGKLRMNGNALICVNILNAVDGVDGPPVTVQLDLNQLEAASFAHVSSQN
jgi:hypothetical protein